MIRSTKRRAYVKNGRHGIQERGYQDRKKAKGFLMTMMNSRYIVITMS